MAGDLVPSLQVEDEETALLLLNGLMAAGFRADARPISELDDNERAEWLEEGSGGWVILVEEDRFDDAMSLLWSMMGSQGEGYDSYEESDYDDYSGDNEY
ncbi:hypothetical protein JW921_09195 [Candidatus Fermentibacterales bacterium]|nr:hypothetical protein [Candidatus Fermentibacterales bacterium]